MSDDLPAAPDLREDDLVTQAERTASRVIDGKAVVVLIDRQELHTLNPVGTLIWELADGRSFGAIVDGVAREFEVERATAVADARRFITELLGTGALQVEGAGR